MSSNQSVALPGKYLTFSLTNNWYGIPISYVREINQITEITDIPRAPAFVKGVINLRGKIIPVVDLALKFGLAEVVRSRSTCVIVLEAESGQVGVIVDQVNEVIDFTAEQIETSPALNESQDLDFLMGLGKLPDRVLLLVDVVRSLSKESFMKTAQVSAVEPTEKSKAA
jgi:purine-binding chemotaxis protein CheW